VETLMVPVNQMRSRMEAKGIPVPRIVAGGTPTFPFWAKLKYPGLEMSPGTFVLYDHAYGSTCGVPGLVPAAVLVTRVVSRPTPTRVSFDLGHKAVAADPPAGKRCVLLDVSDYTPVLHNEEHFTIETSSPSSLEPGDIVFAIPTHICPTCALHQKVYVVEDGLVTGTWSIACRDRFLTV
jgi:D-serine deaminase-like pyridoxal phosphate-dependent protein